MKILIAEDEERVAQAIKRSLVDAGHDVSMTASSDKALEMGLKNSFDLLVLDRMLRGQYDGIDIVKKLREAGVGVPILLLTALGEVEDRVSGLSLGADDYMVKPFSMKELLARVNILLKRPKLQIGSLLKVEDLELNPETHVVKRQGRKIELSKREYKLLHYLMYNQNQIVSKDKIINHVWDAESIIMTNTVEVYIGYLRKKIDKDFSDRPSLIHTVFGFGYKLGND